MAERLQPVLAHRLKGVADIEVVDCISQIGSGALPVETLPSAALAINPATAKGRRGGTLERIASAFRALPLPVIGRVQNGVFFLDLRCLENEEGFRAQLELLDISDA
jgi:L-seryl-tRNA(Ser) seleniumtransferase